MNSRPYLIHSLASARRVLAVVLLAGFAVTKAPAQASSGIPPAPASPSQRPLELSPLGDSLQREGTHIWEPGLPERPKGPFFLPPLLPVLGAARPAHPEALTAGYPRDATGESYFMAYGNLAANNLLPDQSAEHIARHRAARLALLAELREQLVRVQDVSAEARAHALAGFAATQTPRLLELEAEAEQIRYELTHLEALKATADDIGRLVSRDEDAYLGPSAPVTFRLGSRLLIKKDPKFSAELASLRQFLSAAHFREGFSSDQRRLLEEMAQENVLPIEPEPGPAAVFFWPAGARIPTPSGLAPEMAEKFEDFQRRKTALKDELRTALERERKQVFNFTHTEKFKALAAAQASRFAELDTLADQLRPALAALADIRTNPAAEFPPALARQVVTVVDHKDALQREVHVQLAEFRRELPAERLKLVRQGSGLAIAIVTDSGFSRNRESVLARIETFNAEIATQFEAYATKRAAVRAAIARHQASVPGAKPGITVDQLATDFLSAYNAREYRNQQRDYAAAVFASGLSPAQRRLLLAAVAADSLQTAP